MPQILILGSFSVEGDEYGINIQAVFVAKAAGETLKK